MLDLDKTNFEEEVLKSEKPFLLDFRLLCQPFMDLPTNMVIK